MTSRRYSKKREQILSVLKREHGVLSAADIHAKLPQLDLATIYRNLELFVADGVVRKLYLSPNGNEAVYEYQHEPHHHAVCTDCEKVVHFTVKDADLQKLLPLDDFVVEDIEITVKGKCGH